MHGFPRIPHKIHALCTLVATLAGGSAFVDIIPLVAVAGDGWEKARIVLGICLYAAFVRRIKWLWLGG